MPNDVNTLAREHIEVWLGPFLFALARAGAVAAFLPLPWIRPVPRPARAFLALALALLVFPVARQAAAGAPVSAVALAGEAAIGVAIGAVIAWLSDVILFAMQIASAQAGFSFASMIDPATQADSTVLQLLGQLITGLLFTSLGTDRELIRLIGHSFETIPPGGFSPRPEMISAIIGWTGQATVFAVRLALPMMLLPAMVDVALAVTSRLQPQLQLLTLAFPVKILAMMAILAASAGMFPRIFEQAAARAVETAAAVLSR